MAPLVCAATPTPLPALLGGVGSRLGRAFHRGFFPGLLASAPATQMSATAFSMAGGAGTGDWSRSWTGLPRHAGESGRSSGTATGMQSVVRRRDRRCVPSTGAGGRDPLAVVLMLPPSLSPALVLPLVWRRTPLRGGRPAVVEEGAALLAEAFEAEIISVAVRVSLGWLWGAESGAAGPVPADARWAASAAGAGAGGGGAGMLDDALLWRPSTAVVWEEASGTVPSAPGPGRLTPEVSPSRLGGAPRGLLKSGFSYTSYLGDFRAGLPWDRGSAAASAAAPACSACCSAGAGAGGLGTGGRATERMGLKAAWGACSVGGTPAGASIGVAAAAGRAGEGEVLRRCRSC